MKRILRNAVILVTGSALSGVASVMPASSYVQNGLIGHYDALENGGAGVHDATATTLWKDLSGAAVLGDMTLSGVDTVGSDYVLFATGNGTGSDKGSMAAGGGGRVAVWARRFLSRDIAIDVSGGKTFVEGQVPAADGTLYWGRFPPLGLQVIVK